MQEILLPAEKREKMTKGQIGETRRSGRIPAIVYGREITPVSISVDEKMFNKIIHGEHGENALIGLEIPGADKHTVIIKEIQRHPTKDNVIHIDFHRISLKDKIEITVPIEVTGKCPGIEAGGVLEHVLWELKIKCLPTNIPENITMDVSSLELGKSLLVKDITPPEDVEILNDPEQTLVHVVLPKVEEVTPAEGAVAETAAEPEVISRGKKKEEGEEGAPAAGGKEAPGKAAPAKAAPKAEEKK